MTSPLLTAAGSTMSLNLISSPYLSGVATNPPTYQSNATVGLISSNTVAGLPWITANGNTVQLQCPSIIVSLKDFYQVPACTLTITVPSMTSVLYVKKDASGTAQTTAKIGLLETQEGYTAAQAITQAENSITGVFEPLAVFTGDASGNQSIIWELDQQSAYSAPILNQFQLMSGFEANVKSFFTSQFTALMNDLTGFAAWQTGWNQADVVCNFTQTTLPNNQLRAINMDFLHANASTTIYNNNAISINPVRRTVSGFLNGFLWGSGLSSSDFDTWSDYYQCPILYSQNRGELESQFDGLIPNFSSYTGTYYYAPTEDWAIANALTTTNGNPANGSNAWQKLLIWSSIDGNLYGYLGAANELDLGNAFSLPMPYSVNIELRDASTNDVVVSWPGNPLAAPTFQSAWQN